MFFFLQGKWTRRPTHLPSTWATWFRRTHTPTVQLGPSPSLWWVKNNDIDIDIDKMMAHGGRYQRCGRTYCLHFQGWVWRVPPKRWCPPTTRKISRPVLCWFSVSPNPWQSQTCEYIYIYIYSFSPPPWFGSLFKSTLHCNVCCICKLKQVWDYTSSTGKTFYDKNFLCL